MSPTLTRRIVTVLLVVVAGSAEAGDPAEKGRKLLAQKRYQAAIAELTRARQETDGGYDYSCEIGLAYAGLKDHLHAHFYLGLCRDSSEWPKHAGRATAARELAEKALRAGEFAPVTIEVAPPGVARIDALEKRVFTTPRTVWLPIGVHTIGGRAEGCYGIERQVILYGRDPETVSFALEPLATVEAEAEVVDFGDEAALESTTPSDLPDLEHEELMPDRYRRGLAATGEAEGGRRSRLSPGIKLGAGFSSLGGGDAPDGGSRVGLAIAVALGYWVSQRLVITPELGVAMRGGDDSEIDYLSLPVLAGYRLLARPELTLELGPELAVAVRNQVAGKITPFDLSLVAGAGIGTPLMGGVVTLELRYGLGLLTVDGESPGGEIRNRTVTLLGGYRY